MEASYLYFKMGLLNMVVLAWALSVRGPRVVATPSELRAYIICFCTQIRKIDDAGGLTALAASAGMTVQSLLDNAVVHMRDLTLQSQGFVLGSEHDLESSVLPFGIMGAAASPPPSTPPRLGRSSRWGAPGSVSVRRIRREPVSPPRTTPSPETPPMLAPPQLRRVLTFDSDISR